MFGLFKRSKIKNWEISLLRNTLKKLPPKFNKLEEQVNAGLLTGVKMHRDNTYGNISFTCNPKLYAQYYTCDEIDFRLTGIKVYDRKSRSQLLYTIYINDGIIKGYSITGADKYALDAESVDTSWFFQIFKEEKFSSESKTINFSNALLINVSEVYEIVIGDKIYFHLKDLENNIFIGMDFEKNIYKIIRETLEMTLIEDYDLAKYLVNYNKKDHSQLL